MDDLERTLARCVPANGDAAAVVDDLDASVGVDRDVDSRRDVGLRLVDAVVDDLPYELMEPARVRRPDVHARPLADRRQALENLDGRGGVLLARLDATRSADRLRGHGRTSPETGWMAIGDWAAGSSVGDGVAAAPREMIV